jgi:protein gp37
MHPGWARELQHQCSEAGVPYFFKQWGNWKPLDQFDTRVINSAGKHAVVRDDGRFIIDTDIADPPRAVFTFNMGKKGAGRKLDGVEYNQMPACPPELQRRRERRA